MRKGIEKKENVKNKHMHMYLLYINIHIYLFFKFPLFSSIPFLTASCKVCWQLLVCSFVHTNAMNCLFWVIVAN